jgi:transposase
MFNRVTCTEFLQKFYRDSTRGSRRVVVISDNAQYHHARMHKEWRQMVAPRFELSFLPPASPQLNSIERVWKLTRRICVHNRYFPRLTDVMDAVEWTFEDWRKGNGTLRRLCAIT